MRLLVWKRGAKQIRRRTNSFCNRQKLRFVLLNNNWRLSCLLSYQFNVYPSVCYYSKISKSAFLQWENFENYFWYIKYEISKFIVLVVVWEISTFFSRMQTKKNIVLFSKWFKFTKRERKLQILGQLFLWNHFSKTKMDFQKKKKSSICH